MKINPIKHIINITLLCLLMALQSYAIAEIKVTYYIPDASGSPVAATDEQGNIKWRKHYKPFGEEIEQGLASHNNHVGYTGHVHDRSTGLTYMGARYYDPVVGRFMAMDPAAVVPEDPRTFNRFSYANNNPYKFVDPDGKSAKQAVVLGTIFCAVKSACRKAVAKSASKLGNQLQKNKAAGKKFENKVEKKLKKTDTDVSKEVTVKTDSGTKTRLDFISKDKNGNIKCTECKSSDTAPLTKNQKTAFPELESTGGIVVGKGKPGFPGGTNIPPTKVDIVRP